MNNRDRYITLGLAVALIVVTLYYLQPAPVLVAAGNAPELQGIAGYINSKNITIGQHVGKNVILVDFWTYTCINCQRTLPYVVSWDEKYRKDGLVIIGVHTPEFAFEKDYDNVKRAVEKWGITYPVVLDNDFSTWRAFANQYWPHKYLIDIHGNIVYDHVGEGGYEETEKRIQEELQKRADVLKMGKLDMNSSEPSNTVAVDFSKIKTPEIYFGYNFIRGNLGQVNEIVPEKAVAFTIPSTIGLNTAYLNGSWVVHDDGAELVSDAGYIALTYSSKVVNIVASGPSEILVRVDGKAPSGSHGYSVNKEGKGRIDAQDLYELVNGEYGQHTIIFHVRKGFRIYTFTFG